MRCKFIDLFDVKELIPVPAHGQLKGLIMKGNRIEYSALCIRLITGGILIKNKITDEEIELNVNYGVLPLTVNNINRSAHSAVLKFIGTFDQQNLKYRDYFFNTKLGKDKEYFENICLEIKNFYFKKNKGAHSSAFLHLYRLLEQISFSLPLFASLYNLSYTGFYNSVKDLFISLDKDDGELKFFNKFIHDSLFKSQNFKLLKQTKMSQAVSIPASCDSSMTKLIYDTYDKLLNKPFFKKKVSLINGEITIEFQDVYDFVAILRNKYFHFSSGTASGNYSSSELLESDIFYAAVNEIFLNWFGIVFNRIIAGNIYHFQGY